MYESKEKGTSRILRKKKEELYLDSFLQNGTGQGRRGY